MHVYLSCIVVVVAGVVLVVATILAIWLEAQEVSKNNDAHNDEESCNQQLREKACGWGPAGDDRGKLSSQR